MLWHIIRYAESQIESIIWFSRGVLLMIQCKIITLSIPESELDGDTTNVEGRIANLLKGIDPESVISINKLGGGYPSDDNTYSDIFCVFYKA